VLLIACTNLASCVLARAGGRQKEIAVTALGAGKLRLVRSFCGKFLALSVAGHGGRLAAGQLDLELLPCGPPIDIP